LTEKLSEAITMLKTSGATDSEIRIAFNNIMNNYKN